LVLTIEEEVNVDWNCSLFAFLVSNSRVIARVSTLITDQSSNIGCKVHCEALQEDIDGKGQDGNKFTVAYDKLVIATGAEASTFGITGVHEHALFLRDVKNAMDIRTKLLLNLMKCEIPGLPEAPPLHLPLLQYPFIRCYCCRCFKFAYTIFPLCICGDRNNVAFFVQLSCKHIAR
jgi:hypothetical protein